MHQKANCIVISFDNNQLYYLGECFTIMSCKHIGKVSVKYWYRHSIIGMNLNITSTTITVVRTAMTATRTVMILKYCVSKYCVDLNNEYNNIYQISGHRLL